MVGSGANLCHRAEHGAALNATIEESEVRMSKWIELKQPIFAWIRYGQGGTVYPAIFHGVISQQESKDILRRYELKPGEESLRLDELSRRYPIDRERPVNVDPEAGSYYGAQDRMEGRLSTATFVLGVTALLLFILAALIFPA